MKKIHKTRENFSNTRSKSKYLIGLIVLILGVACDNLINRVVIQTVDLPDFEYLQESYAYSLSFFDDSLVDHFPDLHEGNCLHYSSNYLATEDEFVYLRLVMKHPSSKIGYIRKRAQNAAQVQSNIINPIWQPIDIKNQPQNPIAKIDSNANDTTQKLPRPDFNYCKELPQFPKSFFRNATVYLFANGGINQQILSGVDPIHYNDTIGNNNNQHFNSSYTKGMSIYKNIVVYWIEIW